MSKIKEILMDKNSVLAFDVDGVLAILELGEYHHYDLTEEEWVDACNNGINYYTEEFVCKKIKKFLENKDMNRIYVITAVQCENEEKFKLDFVQNNYGIPKENVYFVQKNNQKTDVLMQISKKYPELEDHQIAMVDDTISILNDIKEKTNFSTIHISSFIDM